jgi:hypothetical protein
MGVTCEVYGNRIINEGLREYGEFSSLCKLQEKSAHNLCIARPLQDKITNVTASTLGINLVTKFMCCEACLKAERSHLQQFLQNMVNLSSSEVLRK